MKTEQAIEYTRHTLRRQRKALATEETYLFWLRRYVLALRNIPAILSSEKKVEQFLTVLATCQHVAASTQSQALNALLYFYKEVLRHPLANIDALRAKRPVHERHAPTVAETQALLQTIHNEGGYPTNLIARMLYGCGLRVSDPLNLRIKDASLEQRTLSIRGAKGGKDRLVAWPTTLLPEVAAQIQHARVI